MNNEIIEFKDDAGMPVKFTSQDIRERLCPNATESELALCVELCNRQHLNPFTKEVYLVKYRDAPASIITSYQVFNRRANRQPNYGGIESGVVVLRDGEVVKKKGSAVYKMIGEQLIGGWAEVAFTDGKKPAYVELALTDYSTGKSNWARMPGVMIEKCAKAGAWRLAYPDEFGGMYTGERWTRRSSATWAPALRPSRPRRRARGRPARARPVQAVHGGDWARQRRGHGRHLRRRGLLVGQHARHDAHAGAPRGLVDGGGDRGPQGATRARRPRAGARARL